VIAILHDPATASLDRLLALEALARIGPAHPRTLSAVVQALERGLPKDVAQAEGVDRAELARQYRRSAADVLSLFGPSAAPAIPALLQAARDVDEPLRRAAVASLGAIRNPITLEPLTDILLFDPSPAVQDAAAVSLAQLGPTAVDVLQRLLDDPEDEIIIRAADGLRQIGPPARQASARLAALLDGTSPEVGIAAAEALWAVSAMAELPVETAFRELASPERQVRIRSHRLILTIGRRTRKVEILRRLETLANDRDPRVRQSAGITLRELLQELNAQP
jgi:HEAT repeat protein